MSKFEVNKYCTTEVKSVFDFRFGSHLNPFDGGLGTAPKRLRISEWGRIVRINGSQTSYHIRASKGQSTNMKYSASFSAPYLLCTSFALVKVFSVSSMLPDFW